MIKIFIIAWSLVASLVLNSNVAQATPQEIQVCAKYRTANQYYSKGYKGHGVLLTGAEYGEPFNSYYYNKQFLLINWDDGDYTLFDIDPLKQPKADSYTEYRDKDGRFWRVKSSWLNCY